MIGQTLEAFRAVETAAIVINAHSGIEVNTRRVFQEAGKPELFEAACRTPAVLMARSTRL